MPNVARPEGSTVRLTIDGREAEGAKGMTVLQVARANGIYIPHLCDYEGLTPFSGCRVCLVEIDGRRGLDTSCTIVAAEGMVVHTATPLVREMQRGVMEALLSEHPDRCLTCPREDRCPPDVICQRDNLVTDRCVLCPRNKQCELQRVVDFVGIRWNRLGEGRRPPKPERSNPFVERNESYCIYCARCVRVCEEVRGIFAFGLAYRGPHTRISVDFDKELKDSPCNFCGSCAVICPTGALIKRDSTYGRIADYTVPSVCPYCGDGCRLYLNTRQGRLVNVTGDLAPAQNEGQLCVKGQFAYDYVYAKDRLTTPLLRDTAGVLRPASWDEAVDDVAAKLARIHDQYGPAAIGVVGSGHCSNEDAYLLQKFARAVLGTNNVDQIDRLSSAASVDALLSVFGTAGATNPTADIALAGCVLAIGSSTVESHEITALRMKKAVRGGAKLIVVDPRRTSLERFAHLYLQPRPGTDLALINSILHVIVDENIHNQEFIDLHCEGFAALRESLQAYEPRQASAITGIAAEDIIAAARIFASAGTDGRYLNPKSWLGTLVDPGARLDGKASCIVYGSGVTQQSQGSALVLALANLAMITGNIGNIGGGLYPRIGQPNLQGALDMGLWAGLLPGQRKIDDLTARQALRGYWDAEPPQEQGLTLLEMLESARQGKLRALYVVGTDMLRTVPNPAYVRECLNKLDLLVVQDLFPSEMVSLAHAVFPAAANAERDGTYTSLERRVQLFRRAIDSPAQCRPDWQIIADVARRTSGRLRGQSNSHLSYRSSRDVFEEIAAVVPTYAGITYERLLHDGLQWPVSGSEDAGTDVLFAEGFAGRKAALAVTAFRPVADVENTFPIRLIVGREIYHAGGGARTRRAPRTAAFRPHARLEIHPDQAARLGLEHRSVARIQSSFGEVFAAVECNDSLPAGIAFLPIHYAECPANSLFGWPGQVEQRGRSASFVDVRIEKQL